MKKLFSLLFFVLIFNITHAQNETYTHYFVTYMLDNMAVEMAVCRTESYKYVSDDATGMRGVSLIPEANFRKWLQSQYGSRVGGIAFYACTSAEQGINYYKNHAETYQGHTPFTNSSYCSSIFTITYKAPQKPAASNSSTSTNNSSYTKPNTTSTTNSNNSNVPNTPSTTQTKTTTTTGSTYQQRQAAIEAEELRKYNEQRERIGESQKRSQALDNQIVQGTTELVGLIGNIAAQNRKEREKKEAKKEAERRAVVNEKQAEKQEIYDIFNSSAQRNLQAFASGDEDASIEVGYAKLRLDKPDQAEKWYGEAAERGDVRGMNGMAEVAQYRIEKLLEYGSYKSNKKQIEDLKTLMLQWYEKAVNAGSVEACSTIVMHYKGYVTSGAIIKNCSFLALKGDQRIIAILKHGEMLGYITPLHSLYHLLESEGIQLLQKAQMANTADEKEKFLQLAVEKYNPEAIMIMAEKYVDGENKNMELASQLWGKAALLGSLTAMRKLQNSYETGIGLEKHLGKATAWRAQAALVNELGRDIIGKADAIYWKGMYVYNDQQEELRLFNEAADLGHVTAMDKLSEKYRLYFNEPQKSLEWKEKARIARQEKPFKL